MNRLLLCCFVAGLLTISLSLSIEEEFIKQPKEKKVYPSCQQYTELNAEVVEISNKLLGILGTFLKNVTDIQRAAITEINEYVDGDKECFVHNATKKERAEAYAKKTKVKEKLQETIKKMLLINDQMADFKMIF